MKNNNKYYTPEINELRVGLECVYTTLTNSFIDNGGFLNPDSHNEDDLYVGKLDSYSLKELFELFPVDTNIQVRVKHLDSKDIESYDFINTAWEGIYLLDKSTYDKEEDEYSGFVFKLYYNEKTHAITIEKLSVDEFTGEPYYDLYEGNQNHIVKDITINNKNELGKLLKQMKIIGQ